MSEREPGAPARPAAVAEACPLQRAVVERAVAWYVLMASGDASERDHGELQRWLALDTAHALAWQRLQGIAGRLSQGSRHTGPEVARTTLARADEMRPSRRQALKLLAWGGVGVGAGYLLQRQLPWEQAWDVRQADLRSATGERREVLLPDGSRLQLDTATAVDIHFDERQRVLVLHEGEILVETATDPARRPFLVRVDRARLRPVGTRFVVRRGVGAGCDSRLGVSEGAVELSLEGRPPLLVEARRQVCFGAGQVGLPEPLDDARLAWAEGMLVAEGMRLSEFIAELDRYHPGRIRCAPEAAELRITGTWPLDGAEPTERILASLERQLPVHVRRLSRYWVTVLAR